ncbi:plant UBX domain-containing protein 2 [Magnolia sinica]|uniref:plant UBX domain-containing protein 2 n=1 Tax=Magnolia sinica TaxID=86752 RepID=UPI00265AE5EB|nr:plant UBX domain-containing protein 2 [Magnolia sinica]
MDDVKGKVKGFMKKVNNPFTSSSSGKFKGQGRVLGSSSAGPTHPIHGRSTPQSIQPKPDPKQPSSSLPRSNPKSRSPPPRPTPEPNRREPGNFDPFDPFISSGKRAPNGTSVSIFQCPVCGDSFASEEEVSAHVESCLSYRSENAAVLTELPDRQPDMESRNELVAGVGAFLSGEPSDGSVDIVLKLLRNIIREPGNDKFRRIRMSNPKIKEALGAATGGIELLECIGFRLQQEGDEMWATLEAPSEDQISLIKEAVSLLESRKAEDSSLAVCSIPEVVPIERKKIDRQVRVFFSVPESVAGKIDLPDSFYNLSAEEVKREAELRRKKMAESQLLIPKSYKEKQAKAARRRYKATVIRIQFPDGIVLQGVFLPWEPTTALYEFVSSSLKEPSLEFELLQPPMPKRRVIPRFPSAGERAPTLDEEDLVPSALIKFKPIETDSIVFTGLCNELLEVSEPLTATTALVPP